MSIFKAIIPSAGIGSRFLPATKTVPKEMIPLIDKPAIQYSIEEGVKAGLKNFIVVTGKNKHSLEDYFDTSQELESFLKNNNKEWMLAALNKITEQAEFTYVRQREPLGLGNAIWAARHCIGKEHVAIMLPDDIFVSATSGISQLMKIALQEKCNVLAIQEVPLEDVSRYGVIAIKKQFSPNLFQVKSLVEKPTPTDAPTNLAIVGRYVLSPNIFPAIESVQMNNFGEIQLTDAIQQLITDGEKVFAYKLQGTRYDIGSPMGWLKTNISLALKHPSYSKEISSYLKELDKDLLVMEGQAEYLSKKSKEIIF